MLAIHCEWPMRCAGRASPAVRASWPAAFRESFMPRLPVPWKGRSSRRGVEDAAFSRDRNERMSVASILGPGGAIARAMANYEVRKEQLQMAEAVADAIASGRHL